MTFSIFDMLGFEIKEDDYVVGSFMHGRSASTRIGKIIEKKVIHPKGHGSDPNYYLKIDWIHGWGRPNKPTLISVDPGEKSHLLKVDIDGIN